jgi:CBS domain-containing protein
MGLREDFRREPVSSMPLRTPVLVEPTMSTRDVLAKMKKASIGCAFIIDQDGRPIGKFTERLLVRLLHRQPALLDKPINQHEIPLQGCVCLTDPISRVVDFMQDTGLRFVCVVDENGRVVGLTGQKGVLEYIAERFPRQIKVQLMESKLYMDQREGA